MSGKMSINKTELSTGEDTSASEAATIDEIRKDEYKILLIDDNETFRKSFSFMLKRKFKAQVEDIGSAKSGIEKLRDGSSYDLIFIDMIMPEMSGIEAYHELRKINSRMRVVIMSAYSDSEEWRKAQEFGDITLLHKPIPEDSLIKILRGCKGE